MTSVKLDIVCDTYDSSRMPVTCKKSFEQFIYIYIYIYTPNGLIARQG